MVSTRTPRGGSPAAASAWATCRDARPMSSPSTLAVKRHVALRHVAVDLAGPHAPSNRRHVADHQVDQRVDRLDRQGLDVFRLVDPQGRHLELDQVVEARLHVDPVVERGEAGRRRRHDDGMGHVRDLGAGEPRLLAVDRRPRPSDSRATARTRRRAGTGMRLMLAAIFSACCRTSFRSVPTIRTAIGVGEPKLMTWVTISPGSKPKVDSFACCSASVLGQAPLLQPLGQPGDHLLGQDLAQPLAELVELDPAVLGERDPQLAVVGPAHEQHHVVDAEVRGDLADVAHRDLRCSRASPRARSPRGT